MTVEATQAPTAASASVLPTLRQDLSIYKGPPNSSGAPTYTLHDPPSNKYFRIGWAEFEILSRWPRGSSADEIARQVSEETTLFVETDKVEAFANFLHQNNLLQVSNAPEIKRMALLKESNRPSAAMRLLRNHLFIRIPVLQPDRLLKFLRPVADVAASRAFLTITGIVAILGVYLAGRQWDHFMETMVTLFNWSSILLIAVTVAVVKILHEFGHALTAHRFGCRVPTMGLSFMVFWPILYTDTIDAWKLPSKAQRLKISGAGIGEIGRAHV